MAGWAAAAPMLGDSQRRRAVVAPRGGRRAVGPHDAVPFDARHPRHLLLSRYHGDREVGEGRIETQPGPFTLAGEGLTVGRDSGEPYIDLEAEDQAMLACE
ncbi:hypothetical protein ACFVT6_19815 [Streptomyces sp. NPDC058049]|uniref:hypothetical protein n=1 Tax=Streptomyces sp. NPDC058049 TaxID=3346314 RepID=UPI0036F11FFE